MRIRISLALSLAATLCCLPSPSNGADIYRTPPEKVRDILWVWSTPDREQPELKNCGPGQFVQAPSPEKLKMLDLPNVMMAGAGLPDDFAEAVRLSDSVADAANVVWEVLPDGETEYEHSDFVYKKRLSDIRRLAAKHPNQVGIMLDDLSSVAMQKGFDPEKLKEIRQQLVPYAQRIKLWSVIYAMSFGKPGVDKLMEYSDVINLWEWYADRLVNLEQNVEYVEKKQPGKPIVLGLYLHDYGDNRSMPLDIMKQQCQTALKLAHQGRIQGIVFLTIDNNAEVVSFVQRWIAEVGDQALGQQ